MKLQKTLDCVQMKNEIQSRLIKEREGMSDAEIEKAMEKKLKTSQSPAAQLWRLIQRTSV